MLAMSQASPGTADGIATGGGGAYDSASAELEGAIAELSGVVSDSEGTPAWLRAGVGAALGSIRMSRGMLHAHKEFAALPVRNEKVTLSGLLAPYQPRKVKSDKKASKAKQASKTTGTAEGPVMQEPPALKLAGALSSQWQI